RPRAVTVLCAQGGLRVQKLGPLPDAEPLLAKFIKPAAAVRDAIAAPNPALNIGDAGTRQALQFEKRLLEYVLSQRSRLHAGDQAARATAVVIVRIVESAAAIGLARL